MPGSGISFRFKVPGPWWTATFVTVTAPVLGEDFSLTVPDATAFATEPKVPRTVAQRLVGRARPAGLAPVPAWGYPAGTCDLTDEDRQAALALDGVSSCGPVSTESGAGGSTGETKQEEAGQVADHSASSAW